MTTEAQADQFIASASAARDVDQVRMLTGFRKSALILMVTLPLLVYYMWICVTYYGGDMQLPLTWPELLAFVAHVTVPSLNSVVICAAWFALQVLFGRVGEWRIGLLHISTPDPATLNLKALALSLLAAVLLFALHRGVLTTLAVCSAAALAAFMMGL